MPSQFLLKVESNVTQLLLDVTDDFMLCRHRKGITTLHEILGHMIGRTATGKVKVANGVHQREARGAVSTSGNAKVGFNQLSPLGRLQNVGQTRADHGVSGDAKVGFGSAVTAVHKKKHQLHGAVTDFDDGYEQKFEWANKTKEGGRNRE
jgi:hypothetical protein